MREIKRTGVIVVAMVVAFLSISTVYASWSDGVQTEDTDGGDLIVVDYSGSTIYKYLGPGPEPAPDSLVAWHGWMGDDPHADDPDYLLVASAGATQAESEGVPIEDAVSIWFDNMFPCEWLTVDILLGYVGPGPVEIQAEIVEGSIGGDQALIDNLDVEFLAYRLDPDFVVGSNPHAAIIEPVDVGVEVESGDLILVAMRAHLPQDNSLMRLNGSFTARIYASGEEQQQNGDHESAWAKETPFGTGTKQYVAYDGSEKSVPLVFGQGASETQVGWVTFSAPAEECVDISIDVDVPPYDFSEDEAVNVQIHYWDALPTTNLAPGSFYYQLYAPRGSSPWSTVDDAGICVPVKPYYAVHVNVD